MSYLIFKEAPEAGFYVAWSNVMDAPVIGGSAEEMIEFLYEDSDLKRDRHPEGRTPEDKIARADQFGTSARHSFGGAPLQGSWEDPEQLVRDLLGGWAMVPRPLLGELTRRWMAANWGDPRRTARTER